MKTPPIVLLLSVSFALGAAAQEPASPAAPPAAPPASPAPAAAPATAPTNQPATPPAQPGAAPEGPRELTMLEKAPVPQLLLEKTGEGGTNEIMHLIVLDDVPLADAIRTLARQSNLNFQFDPKVMASNQPMVTIRFENVTAEEALEAVLDNHNLQLTRDAKSRIGRITTKLPKAEEPLYAQIIQLKYSDPTNMVRLVKSALSTRSSVIADTRTSQLIVTTTLKEMESAVALIEKLDTQTKQVLIEAHLLETSRNPTSIKGIDWSGTLEAQRFSFGNNASDGLGPSAPAANQGAFSGQSGGVLQNPALIASTAGGLLPHTAFLNADGVNAVLSFLNKDTETEVVATPRAVTLDNQPAMLSVTRAFPIINTTPGAANVPSASQITYTNLGVILNVTPRITADKNIALHVVPEVSNIDGKDEQTINGAVNRANIYAIRKIETSVLIPSGHTLVMGGLINDTANNARTKVPILGDLPGIGLAFRKETKSRNKQNLMIFITPTIVEEEAFQVTDRGTKFLKNRITERPEPPETTWDSAKPHDWTKPVD
jgi:type IV pilus assembly protein PilQ